MTKRILAATSMVLLAAAVAACGDDDEGRVDVPEEGTGSAYTQAIIEANSHDEVLLPGGGDMVVAVRCDSETGLAAVTAVADGLGEGTYVGVFEPATGVDVSLQVVGAGESAAVAQMALAEAEYVVTFESIEGGEFDVKGC